MEIILKFIHSLIELSNAMSPYILFGLIFAGILHELVPQSLVTKHLGKENVLSVIKSTLFGIPLPVCSCGVIPLATSIKKSGASKGATLSFLISTPITGVDSILATYGVFGWIFTIYRIFSSMIIAMVAGVFINIFDKKEEPEKVKFSLNAGAKKPSATFGTFSTAPKMQEHKDSDLKDLLRKFSLTKAFRYSFVSLLGDIAKPLFWGLILGAAISVAVPQDLSEVLAKYTWLSYLISISIAVPMYVCATASLPIAAALMLGGVSPGAAFVFLSAGPATNIVTIGVVKKMLGSYALYAYIGSIAIGSILFGLGLDYVFSVNEIDAKSIINIDENASFIAIISSVILWISIFYFMSISFFRTKKEKKD